MLGEPVAAEAGVMLQQPEVRHVFTCVLLGKLSLDHHDSVFLQIILHYKLL